MMLIGTVRTATLTAGLFALGKRPDWKKAIVTLEEGETLSFV